MTKGVLTFDVDDHGRLSRALGRSPVRRPARQAADAAELLPHHFLDLVVEHAVEYEDEHALLWRK